MSALNSSSTQTLKLMRSNNSLETDQESHAYPIFYFVRAIRNLFGLYLKFSAYSLGGIRLIVGACLQNRPDEYNPWK